MDFRPSDAQQLLVSTAREFLRRRCPPELVQAMATDARGLPDDLWKEISMLGWPGLLVAPELGGSGGALLDVILLVEEMGRAGLPGPFVPSAVVATTLLGAAASPAQRERLLPALATGDALCVVAMAEESGAADPGAVLLEARGGRLDGHKLFVRDAHRAKHLVVVARGAPGPSLFLLEAARPGIAWHAMESISGEKLFEVSLSGVFVSDADLLGAAGQGGPALGASLQAGALARAAEMVGAAARMLDIAVEHARTRVQSGRPIGSFQAIQHHCADMLQHVDSARYLVQRAAWRADTGQPADADVAMAKAHAGEAALAVARKAHQVLGAIGYCEEHVLHRLHKRVQAASADFGGAGDHLETVAAAIGLV